ncbi:MAG: undecaprenyl-diphosphate phosphatase [Rubricoccaceae bacterium]
MRDLLNALILGLVEGVTEFIPISSTGHLILTTDLLGLDPSEPRMVVFNIVIQLAAILAVVWAFRAKILDITRRLPTDPSARRFALAVVVGCVPAAVLGFLLDDFIEAHLFNPLTVAGALVTGGMLILIVEWYAERRRVTVERADDIALPEAWKVGLAQCLALFPGMSRSASTIMGGLAFGLSRVAATEFSFFLAIPIMVGASGLKLVKSAGELSAADAPFFLVGCVAAFVAALASIHFLLRFVATNTFRPFAWYRIAVGVFALAYYLYLAG